MMQTQINCLKENNTDNENNEWKVSESKTLKKEEWEL
jgi:hypothetical protein